MEQLSQVKFHCELEVSPIFKVFRKPKALDSRSKWNWNVTSVGLRVHCSVEAFTYLANHSKKQKL
jgi:hypothetical protein